MTLAPLLNASPAIQLHAFAAIMALGLGGVQLYMPKGGRRHKMMGWVWLILMMIIAVSSFWIHEIKQYKGYSLIHLLSVWTVVSLPMAVFAIRGGQVQNHARYMKSLYFFALVVAGAFTLLPGRVMYQVIFGG